MAQITSAMAAKYLRKLNEEHDALLQKEKKSDTYTVSVQEKPEDVRPEYDYAAVQLHCGSKDFMAFLFCEPWVHGCGKSETYLQKIQDGKDEVSY